MEDNETLWEAMRAHAWHGKGEDFQANALAFTDPAGEVWPDVLSYKNAVDHWGRERPKRIRKRAPSSF